MVTGHRQQAFFKLLAIKKKRCLDMRLSLDTFYVRAQYTFPAHKGAIFVDASTETR